MAHVRATDFCICGDRFAECRLHRSHIGIEYAWQWVSDDQLRAECDRRKLISGDMAIVDLVRASDEGLRAECTRRHIGFDTIAQYANDPHLKLREEAAHWKNCAGIAERHLAEAARERDEWKRRAEAAEAEIAQAKRTLHVAMRECGAVKGDDPAQFIRKLHAMLEAARAPESVRAAMREVYDQSPDDPPRFYAEDLSIAWLGHDSDEQRTLRRAPESGPGIAATKPDNERWGPSDVDRLCDDAD